MSVAIEMTQPSAVEREIKVAGVDLEQLRSQLRTEGARQSIVRHWEHNWVLDRDWSLKSTGRVLRVREQRSTAGDVLGAWLTVKAPLPGSDVADPDPRNKGVKERVERETRIGEVFELLAALKLLGYEVNRRYEKVRSAFLFKGHEVTLDETPIGDFVEIEGAQPRETCVALGLDLGAVQVSTYLELYDRHRARVEEESDPAVRLEADMLFHRQASETNPGARPVPGGFEHLADIDREPGRA